MLYSNTRFVLHQHVSNHPRSNGNWWCRGCNNSSPHWLMWLCDMQEECVCDAWTVQKMCRTGCARINCSVRDSLKKKKHMSPRELLNLTKQKSQTLHVWKWSPKQPRECWSRVEKNKSFWKTKIFQKQQKRCNPNQRQASSWTQTQI